MFYSYFKVVFIAVALLFPAAQPGLLNQCFNCIKGSLHDEANLSPEIPTCDMSLYTDVQDLSTGFDGIVRLLGRKDPKAEGQNPEYFVWKKSVANVSSYVDIQIEMTILATLNNSNVTPRITCRSNDSFIMERIPGIPLFSALNRSQLRLTFDSFKDLSIRMVKVLKTVHSYGVLHLDLHLDNWLIDLSSKKLWLIDFSRGRLMEKNVADQVPIKGRAREIRQGSNMYDPKTDVFELGDSLYSLYLFTEDYNDNDDLRTVFSLMTQKIQHKRPSLDRVEYLLSLAKRKNDVDVDQRKLLGVVRV